MKPRAQTKGAENSTQKAKYPAQSVNIHLIFGISYAPNTGDAEVVIRRHPCNQAIGRLKMLAIATVNPRISLVKSSYGKNIGTQHGHFPSHLPQTR